MFWYLVLEGRGDGRYVGLGGDAWPLEGGSQSAAARRLHDRLMQEREEVLIAGESFGYLCVNTALATEYYELASTSLAGRLAFVEVSVGPTIAAHGLDIGRASGGYSAIESELLVEPEAAQFRQRLNAHELFASREDALEYLEARKGFKAFEHLEVLDQYSLCAIRILSMREGTGAK